MKTTKIILSLAACGLAFSGLAVAQDDDSHGLFTVRASTVKIGKGGEYREQMAKLAAARKAAGHSGVNVWQVIRGPASTYYTVTTADKYADYDEQFDSGMSDGDWARWLSRSAGLIDHAIVTTLRTHGELTIAADSDSAPNMLLLRYSVLKTGTGGDHHEWLAESLVPALQEGGSKGWNVSDVRFGDNVQTWISATRLDSWAQLDEPGPLAQMSERARNNLLDDYSERVESSRTEIIRHLPDLSY